ncbi:ion transporter [Sulfurimonas sp. ST-25]|uniref:ion transporter n=1 Tax=Sulfurimonas sp. ST-25 TaxID=3400151 RepID=UPI003A87C6DB
MKLFSRALVDSAYALESSQRLRRARHSVDNLMNNVGYRYKRYFDLFMMVLILSSVFILVRDVKFPQKDFLAIFNDYIISFIFLIEYLMRFWVSSDSARIIIDQYEKDELLQREFRAGRAVMKALYAKWRYVSSLPAIIDFLAIMPFFHELRLLRLFIIFRVFKLFRYAQNMHHFAAILASKKFELLTLFTFVGLIIFVASVMIYVMEALNPDSKVNTLFDALYWSVVTISTVGYGDVVPVSGEGKIVALVVIVSGVAVLAFATSIVVAAFTEKLDDIRDGKLIQDVQKLKGIYLICGYGTVAQQTASKLRRMGRNVVILDADAAKIAEARRHHDLALAIDPSSLEALGQLGIDPGRQVRAVILLGDTDVENVYTALTLRSMNKELRILSLLHDKKHRGKLESAGVSDIVYAQELIGQLSREYSDQPIAFEALHALRAEHSGVVIDEILIDERMARFVQTVQDLKIRGRRLILLGVESRREGRFVFNPPADFAVEENDMLVVIGENAMLHEYRIDLHQAVHS